MTQFHSINPATAATLEIFEASDSDTIEKHLADAEAAVPIWRNTTIEERSRRTQHLADILRSQREELAYLITLEMGKLYSESLAEIEKCALLCDYYTDNGVEQLADKHLDSDATESFISWEPLGTLLCIMPWNFPFWQLFRAAIPALIAGNTIVMKHATNVPQCARAITRIFTESGLPHGVFINLNATSSSIDAVIRDRRIHAVTLTGSEKAGRAVASAAGASLKKSLLELGGSDAFILLDSANMEQAVSTAVTSRYLNCGQSCIAAKRFIVVESIYNDFLNSFVSAVTNLETGNPFSSETTLAPMARADLRQCLHHQVESSVHRGAECVLGGDFAEGEGYFYQPTILTNVTQGQPAWREELFGPAAAVIMVKNEREAIEVANQTAFGLGGSVWSEDCDQALRVAHRLQSGAAFINGLVKSDPRLPFGGIKDSGYGRELSFLGIREFVNPKTIWIR